jgi:hypothetical protein
MSLLTKPNAALSAPITSVEPDFLQTLPMDNAVGAIVALTAEVYLLRERLAALESQLAARQVLPRDAVELHEGSSDERAARAADLVAYTERVLSELSRSRVPVSQIDPQVTRYLKTHAEALKTPR